MKQRNNKQRLKRPLGRKLSADLETNIVKLERNSPDDFCVEKIDFFRPLGGSRITKYHSVTKRKLFEEQGIEYLIPNTQYLIEYIPNT